MSITFAREPIKCSNWLLFFFYFFICIIYFLLKMHLQSISQGHCRGATNYAFDYVKRGEAVEVGMHM